MKRYCQEGLFLRMGELFQTILHLKSNVLVKVATSDDGWTTLFKDPNDNRLWELTYSSSDSHGGGAPILNLVSLNEARTKYTKFTG